MEHAVIQRLIPPERTLGNRILYLDCVGSTNDYLKNLALQGEPHGTVVLADCQSGGRGRMGRRFESPDGSGVYLSVLLRRKVSPEQLVTLTAWAAVALCEAVEQCCGVRPAIKWTNDILLNGRKLCGILTELVMDGDMPCIVLGIGLNVTTSREEFAALGLAELATSLNAEGIARKRNREIVAAAVIAALNRMDHEFPQEHAKWLELYRERCVTLNRSVSVHRNGETFPAYALAVEDDFTLRVRKKDGQEERLLAGEVSVRGPAQDERGRGTGR